MAARGTASTPARPTPRQQIVGVAWDTTLQPIFDAKCVSCHGDSNTAGIAPYTITDPMTGASVSWTFNLSSGALPAELAEAAGGGHVLDVVLLAWPARTWKPSRRAT